MKKLLIVCALASVGCAYKKSGGKKPKYSVNFPIGSGTFHDYTDCYEIVNGGVRYVNDRGDSVLRMGNLSVTLNK